MPTIVALPNFPPSIELEVDQNGILGLKGLNHIRSLNAAPFSSEPYPINSYYTTIEETNPADVVGGEWEQIDIDTQTDTPRYTWRRIK